MRIVFGRERADDADAEPVVVRAGVCAGTVIRASLLNRPVGQNDVVIGDVVGLALEGRRPTRMVATVDVFQSRRIDRDTMHDRR